MSVQTTSLSDYLQASRKECTTQTSERFENSEGPFSAHLSLSDNRYSIIATLHADAHTRIYQVRDAVLGRVLALKHIDRSHSGRSAYFRRMKERTALNHANILRIYDIDEQRGQIAMEYVAGWNLREVLRLKGTLSIDVALYIAIQLVNGLRHAHVHGIIHHAVMPEHVLLTRQCAVKIIAFRTPGSLRKHQPELDEHAAYMPPEWFSRKELTTASNVYSFGIMVYEMLHGASPFSFQQITAAVQGHQPLLLDEAALPSGLAPILQRCVEVDATRRESDIRAIGEELIAWYMQCQTCTSAEEHLKTYTDFLLMAWADGKISTEEAVFLAQKRAELGVSESAARAAERAVKHELAQLFRQEDARY